MTDDLIGKLVSGYEIKSLIGQGGMAAVYRAQQVSMNRIVALKMLPRQFLNDDMYLKRFHQEVEIVAQLEHRNIVPVHDYGEYDSQPYIVMRYMAGGSVDDMLTTGPLDIEIIASILDQIAPALDFAHSKNILHRDLKPSNVLLDNNGGAYITDFGIARILGDQGAGITTKDVVGTPSYMSPEQAQGQPLDGRSDVYSVGVMLFEMATGRRPFESDTPYSIAIMQVTTPPPSPRAYNPTVSAAVEQVIYKALKKNRDERYPDTAALAQALREAMTAPPSVMDTQKKQVRPRDTQPIGTPQGTSTPSVPPPVSYTPMPSARFTPYEAVMPVLPRRRARSNTLWLNIFLGGIIGCGLLALVMIAATLIVASAQNGAGNNSTPTPTNERPTATVPPPLDPTSAAARATLLAGNAGGDVDLPTAQPSVGIVAVGERATPTLNAIVRDVGGMLLYFAEREDNYDIYTLDLANRVETRLTFEAAADSYPIASPDGSRIAFQSDRDGDFEIFVMDGDGENVRQLTDNPVIDRIPAWSPDGEWITFSSDTRNDSTFDLMRIHPDGTGLETILSNGMRNSHPRWTQDGRYVVFTSGEVGDARTWDIGRLDVASGDVTFLTENNTEESSPTLSPDDERILYIVEDGEGRAAIARMRMDGGDSELLYDGPGYEWGAHYSLDGSFIAFNSDETGRAEIYLMTAAGENVQRLTSEGGFYPSWIPG